MLRLLYHINEINASSKGKPGASQVQQTGATCTKSDGGKGEMAARVYGTFAWELRCTQENRMTGE